MDERHVQNALQWAQRSGALSTMDPQEFHHLLRLLQNNSIPASDLRGKEALDKGSFGLIEIATFHGAPVAVKYIGKGHAGGKTVAQIFRELFLELQIITCVRHPSVVTFMGNIATFPMQGEPHDSFKMGLVFELCAGGNLFRQLHEKKFKYSGQQKLHLAKEVAMGLSYLHSLRIIHRDLSSRNLLLSKDLFHVKIADFGCARRMASDSYNSTTISGSPAWMAPEQLRGGLLSVKVDMWAFGIILWELAKEKKPHGNDCSDLKKMQTEIQKNAADLPGEDCLTGCSSEVCLAYSRIITLLLQECPALRPNAADTLDCLEEIEKHEGSNFPVLEQLEIRNSLGMKLLKFYNEFCPEKISDIDKLIRHYSGEEEKLNASLRQKYSADLNGKYEPPPPPQPEPVPDAEQDGASVEDDGMEEGMEVEGSDGVRSCSRCPHGALSGLNGYHVVQWGGGMRFTGNLEDGNFAGPGVMHLADMVTRFEGHWDNGKLVNTEAVGTTDAAIAALLSKFPISEPLVVKEGGDPKTPHRGAGGLPPAAPRLTPSAAAKAAQRGAANGVTEVVAQQQVYVQQQQGLDSMSLLVERLRCFYSIYNSAHIQQAESVAKYHLGRPNGEFELNDKLRQRYGADLTSLPLQVAPVQQRVPPPSDLLPGGSMPYTELVQGGGQSGGGGWPDMPPPPFAMHGSFKGQSATEPFESAVAYVIGGGEPQQRRQDMSPYQRPMQAPGMESPFQRPAQAPDAPGLLVPQEPAPVRVMSDYQDDPAFLGMNRFAESDFEEARSMMH